MPLVAAGSASIDKPFKKRRAFWKALKNTYSEFADSTSVHGVQYTIDPKGNRCTKCVWAFLVIAFFIFANVLVQVFWERYQSNPTRVNVETNYAPLNELNFPAVTICNIARMSFKRAEYVTVSMNLPSNVTNENMISLLRLTDGFIDPISDVNMSDFVTLHDLLERDRYNVPLTMQNLMVPCDELLIKCRFSGIMFHCNDLFKRAPTWQGYCCTFNFIDNDPASYDVIRKATTSGLAGGLSLAIQPLVEEKTISKVYTEGVKIYIHENDIFPSQSVAEKTIPHHTETYISITPESTISSSQVRQIPPETRGCVFSDEMSLQYFPEYKRLNCELEALMERSFKACQCQPYYFPEVKERPICQFAQIPCLGEKIAIIRNDKGVEKTCPIQCNQLNYRITANSVSFLNFPYTFDSFYDELNKSHMIVHIYMGSQSYRRFRKDLLSNIILLVSNLGGVYSLFVGMSVLSFFEIFYFYTVRLYKNYKQEKANELRMRTNKAAIGTNKIKKAPVFSPNTMKIQPEKGGTVLIGGWID